MSVVATDSMQVQLPNLKVKVVVHIAIEVVVPIQVPVSEQYK